MTLGGVGTITSVFDTLNRLTSAQKPTGERYTMMYDVDSRRTTMQMGNGTTRAYASDSNSRLIKQIELDQRGGIPQRVMLVIPALPVQLLSDDSPVRIRHSR